MHSVLEHLQASGSNASEKLAPEVTAFQVELQHTLRLLEQAGRFYEGWLRLKATLTGGYGPQGQPAAMEDSRRGLAEA